MRRQNGCLDVFIILKKSALYSHKPQQPFASAFAVLLGWPYLTLWKKVMSNRLLLHTRTIIFFYHENLPKKIEEHWQERGKERQLRMLTNKACGLCEGILWHFKMRPYLWKRTQEPWVLFPYFLIDLDSRFKRHSWVVAEQLIVRISFHIGPIQLTFDREMCKNALTVSNFREIISVHKRMFVWGTKS